MNKNNLIYDQKEDEVQINLKIWSESAVTKIKYNNTTSDIIGIAPADVWKNLRNNRSEVHLHVLVIKGGVDRDDITSSLVRSGNVLYGVINMVKFDRIPRYFKHRNLLSDLGLVAIDAEEGNQKE